MYHPRLSGNHYDMGRHYGELLAKSGIDLSPVLAIPEQQTAFGLSCLPIYEQYLPRIMQEVRGLADCLGQRYEAVACWLFALYCFESDHGCSVFAVRSGEHTYFGRNIDMFPEYKKTSESVLYTKLFYELLKLRHGFLLVRRKACSRYGRFFRQC